MIQGEPSVSTPRQRRCSHVFYGLVLVQALHQTTKEPACDVDSSPRRWQREPHWPCSPAPPWRRRRPGQRSPASTRPPRPLTPSPRVPPPTPGPSASSPEASKDAGSQIFAERWNGTQWQQAPTTNIVRQDERLLGVSASGPNDAWAVGNTNSISAASHDTLAAHWNGTAWTITPTPAAASGGRLASLYDVADLSPASAWAVGQGKDARPLAEHWDGTAWSVVPVPVPAVPSGTSFANAVLSKISAVSATDIWAVGTTTAIQGTSVVRFTLAMHYNGTAWSIVKTANTAEPTGLSGVTAISATNAWAVGTGFNNVHDTSASVANKAVIEHWNGTAWSIVASPAGLISVDRISAASATDIWASGQAPEQTIAGVPVPVARTLHWNGSAWSVLPGPTGSDPGTAVTGLSALPYR